MLDSSDSRPAHRRPFRPWGLVAEFGITLITLGVVVLLFAGYQLWGTGFTEARSQRRLKHDFAAATRGSRAPTTTATLTVATRGSLAPTTATVGPGPSAALPAPGAPIAEGEVVGLLEIPKIGVNVAMVQGVNDPDLRRGPGHYPGTPFPGEAGNASIAGHRTTYGAPFFRLNELQPGDQILATTRAGKFLYVVSASQVVAPSHSEVLNATFDNRLTLTTCNPRYSASQRLIVVAALMSVAAPAQPQVVPTTPSTTGGGLANADTPVVANAALSGDHGAWPTTIAWAVALLALWVATRIVARRWRPWPSFGVGVPVCLAAMWMLFENVARLLPGNI